MHKRGQLTILIILGLVIVASVITIYVFRDRLFVSEFERQQALSLQVPTEAAELHEYISDCVTDVLEEPLALIGEQGGYVEIPGDSIGEGSHNPFSNALEIFPGSDFETAYWFYQAANGVPKGQIPSKVDMEQAIAGYVSSNVAVCADDQALYEEHNASVGEIVTEVEILDDEVQVIVDYPVRIELENFIFDFPSFYESVDVPLGNMYDTAVLIMEDENENFYLEELTYDMFVLNEELPLSWSEVDCDREEWEISEVTEDFKTVVLNNILAVKLRNTNYDISEESDRDYFEWGALRRNTDYRANLLYSPEWPLTLDVYPLDDGVLREDTYTGAASPMAALLKNIFCVTSYNFVYDIQYPVLISLYDEESDYTFQFATMVVIDNNQPRENTEGQLELDLVGDNRICQEPTTPLTIYPVEVDDFGGLRDLSEVELSFQCINNLCPLGSTSSRAVGLNTMVPQCVNAQIVAEKDGYQTARETVTTLEESSVTVILERFTNLTYDILVVDAEGSVRNPTSDETIFVTLTEQETGYSVAVSNPPSGDRVVLVPGTYDIVGNVVSEASFDITVPGSSFSKCSSVPLLSLGGLFGTASDTSCTDVEVDEFEVEQAMTGGADLVWPVSRNDLHGASHVTFYVTSAGDPESLEEMEQVLALIDIGSGLRLPELR